jgi:hypothetical protein
VGLTEEFQEAKDYQAEAQLLWRQKVQMFHDISARAMETILHHPLVSCARVFKPKGMTW